MAQNSITQVPTLWIIDELRAREDNLDVFMEKSEGGTRYHIFTKGNDDLDPDVGTVVFL